MPLRLFKNKDTGDIVKTLKNLQDPWEEIIVAPEGKFMECVDEYTNKSKLKGLNSILKERARNHSRDVDLDDTIQINKDNKLGVSKNLLNEKGERRRKIDDI